MWHLYYDNLGNIVSLSKNKIDNDLDCLIIDDQTALQFKNFEKRYIDYKILKIKNQSRLIKIEPINIGTWTESRFYQIPQAENADVLVIQTANLLKLVTDIDDIVCWVTAYDNPLQYLGKLTKQDPELRMTRSQRVSIFTSKLDITYGLTKTLPC